MPKIQDYEKAKCSLFRTPPIDFSLINTDMETMLLEAWKSGISPNDAIASLLKNPEIMSRVKNQIDENLDFQKRAEMAKIEREKKEAIAIKKKEKDEALRNLEATIGEQTKKSQVDYDSKSIEARALKGHYDAAQDQLIEMRKKIREKMRSIGGHEAYQSLMEINNQMISIAAVKSEVIPHKDSSLDAKVQSSTSNTNLIAEYQQHIAQSQPNLASINPIKNSNSALGDGIAPLAATYAKTDDKKIESNLLQMGPSEVKGQPYVLEQTNDPSKDYNFTLEQIAQLDNISPEKSNEIRKTRWARIKDTLYKKRTIKEILYAKLW